MRYSWIVGWTLVVAGMQANAQVAGAPKAEPAAPSASEVSAAKARIEAGSRVSPRQRAELVRAEAAVENQQGADAFLAANRRKPGVKVLPSGVQYRVLKARSGRTPTLESTVRVRYEGRLTDGSSFDRIDDKAGSKLLVKGLVPGLQEALTRMAVGARWELVLPAAQGYGAKGTHGVAPNAVLVYEIELLSIE